MNAGIQPRFLVAAICVVVLAAIAGNAQRAANLSAPVVGYMFDVGARGLRPIEGIVGSATIGRPLDLGFALSQVLTLDANHVIASTSASRELVILNLGVNPPSATVIHDAPAKPSRAAVSVQRTAAAFYYVEARQVLVVTGLPGKPAVSRVIDLSLPSGSLTGIAIANDGNLMAFAVDDGGREAIYGWTASSESARFLMSAVSVGGMAITRNGGVVVADRSANEVFAIWDAGGAAVRQFLAGAGEGVSAPSGAAVGGNDRIYVANAGSSAVMVMDSGGHYLESRACGCDLTGIDYLQDSVFRLTDRIDRTIFLLDTSSADEPIVFVPPSRD